MSVLWQNRLAIETRRQNSPAQADLTQKATETQTPCKIRINACSMLILNGGRAQVGATGTCTPDACGGCTADRPSSGLKEQLLC